MGCRLSPLTGAADGERWDEGEDLIAQFVIDGGADPAEQAGADNVHCRLKQIDEQDNEQQPPERRQAAGWENDIIDQHHVDRATKQQDIERGAEQENAGKGGSGLSKDGGDTGSRLGAHDVSSVPICEFAQSKAATPHTPPQFDPFRLAALFAPPFCVGDGWANRFGECIEFGC